MDSTSLRRPACWTALVATVVLLVLAGGRGVHPLWTSVDSAPAHIPALVDCGCISSRRGSTAAELREASRAAAARRRAAAEFKGCLDPGQLPSFLVVHHLPKTGGTTLEGQYLNPWVSGTLELPRWHWTNPEARSAASEADAVYLTGHHPFAGVHPLGAANPRTARYTGLFRHPIARCYSLWNHLKTQEDHPSHADVAAKTFAESVAEGFFGTDLNEMVKYLVPDAPDDRAERLRLAKQVVVDHFEVVGLTQHMAESVALLHACVGMPVPEGVFNEAAHARQNSGADRIVEEIDPTHAVYALPAIEVASYELLAPLVADDLELFRFARDVFDLELKERFPERPGLEQGRECGEAPGGHEKRGAFCSLSG